MAKAMQQPLCATGFDVNGSVARQWRKTSAPLQDRPYRVNPAAQSAPLRLCHWRGSGAASWGLPKDRADQRNGAGGRVDG